VTIFAGAGDRNGAGILADALADEFAFADPDDRFELLISLVVDGLARRAANP